MSLGFSFLINCCTIKLMAEAPAAEGGKESAPKKPLNVPLIIAGVNTLAVLAVLGLAVYVKLIYKRPAITEAQERARIEAEVASQPKVEFVKTTIKLDPIQVNLKPTVVGIQTPGGPPPQLKPHFLNMLVVMEIADQSFEPKIRDRMPKFMDQLLRDLGNSTQDELTSVQGRFILRSKLIGLMNELVRNKPTDPPVVTNAWFTDFIVQ